MIKTGLSLQPVTYGWTGMTKLTEVAFLLFFSKCQEELYPHVCKSQRAQLPILWFEPAPNHKLQFKTTEGTCLGKKTYIHDEYRFCSL